MKSFKKFKVDPRFLAPNAIALGFHFVIAILFGLGISGEHATVMALSSIWAAIICLRGDILLLLAPEDRVEEVFLFGNILILSLCLILILVTLLTSFDYSAFSPQIIACGGLLALNELSATLCLKKNRMWTFALIKSIPYPIFLAMLALNLPLTILELWLGCLCITLVISGRPLSIVLFRGRWQKRLRLTIFLKQAIDLLPPGFTTLASIFLSNITVILITELYGAVEAGIWINCYRVLFLPMFYISTSLQISMAKILSEQGTDFKMLGTVVDTWRPIERAAVVYLSFLTLMVLSVTQVSGVFAEERYLFPVISVLLYGLLRMFIHFLATGMQAIRKNRFVLSSLGLEVSALIGFTWIVSPTADQFYFFLSILSLILYCLNRIFLMRFHRVAA